jgi:hypothetical protein
MTERLSDVEQADRLGRRRARMLPVLAIFFLIQQTAFFSNPPAERAVDHVRIGAWVVMSAAILFALYTGGSWFRSAPVRAMLNDEATRANRAVAMQWGFSAAIVAGILIYVYQGVAQFTTREAIHLIVSAGLVAALIRFGMLERRAHA